MSDAIPTDFDPVLHPPARLQIAAVLARVDEAEFARLRSITGVSDSVLSKHLAALGEAGHVRLRKGSADGRQRTWVSMTATGRAAFKRHLAAIKALIATAAE